VAKTNDLKPGQIAPRSGQYQQIGPRGGRGPEVTSVKGEPLPRLQLLDLPIGWLIRQSTNPETRHGAGSENVLRQRSGNLGKLGDRRDVS
jgi:hypothetical protein